MKFEFLKPISNELLFFIESLSTQHLGCKISVHSENEFPNLDLVKIAIVGVLENREEQSRIQKTDLTNFRKQLYSMFPGNWIHSIADLGDILPGETKRDTFFAVQEIISSLIKKQIIPIVIGGSQDITYAMYRAYDTLDQMVNLVAIDSKFDLGKEEDEISKNSYLTKIIVDEPNNLFNYSNVGFQTYYNSQEEIDLIDKLYFDAYRLGDISNNISIAEPVFRDADLVSLDLTSVQSSNSGNLINFESNGFNGKEICALSRYAGISDKVSSFGVFGHQGTTTEVVLMAQIVWYFIEGINFRSNEFPFGSKVNYIKYIVASNQDDIVFYKSNKSERWWIEIPFFSNENNKLKKNSLLPCSHEDYLMACNGEFPERWWKAQKKNNL